MVHIHHRKKTPGGCIERFARSGSGRDSVRGVVGTMNAAWSRSDWLETVQSARKQAQSRVCTPGLTLCRMLLVDAPDGCDIGYLPFSYVHVTCIV